MSSQSRWKHLALIAVVLIMVGAIGWQQLGQQPTPPYTTTTGPTITVARTTETIRKFKLYGVIFFDYNGNGRQEGNEPSITNVVVALNGVNVTATNGTGWYTISEVTESLHRLRPFPPKNFRYMCESASEFRSVQAFYEVLVRNDTRKDIGLMEGFLTMPFSKGTDYEQGFYVNISNSSGVLDWRGGTQTIIIPAGSYGAKKAYGHGGIDYWLKEMTPIVASAPGIAVDHWNDAGGGIGVLIKHIDGYHTAYVHLKEKRVEKGQIVRRGELIGYSGYGITPSGKINPHLHFEVTFIDKSMKYPVDPYRSLVPPLGSSVSLWTKDNDPQFFM